MTLLLVLSSAAHASNNLVPYDGNDQGWEIDVDRERNECGLFKQYGKGTFMHVVYSRELDGFWWSFGHEDWVPYIRPRASYRLGIVTDGKRWFGDFWGDTENGAFISKGVLTLKFLQAIASSNWMDIWQDGRRLRGLSLNGTYDGLRRRSMCQSDFGW